MKAVIDTNVPLAGLLWRGPPHALLEQVRAGTVSLVSSPALLAEPADVIGRSKFDAILTRTNTSRERSLAEVRRLAEVIDPPPLPQRVCRDPDDDEVLALAIAAKADLIVSGDNDLLSLGSFENIPVIAPAQAGLLLPTKCSDGLCGVCAVAYDAGASGEVEHRDYVLGAAQHRTQVLLCCSRAKAPGGEIVVAL